METTLTVQTASAVLSATIEGGECILDGFLRNGRNRIVPTPIALPEAFERDGSREKFDWELLRAVKGDGKFSLLYADKAGSDCQYTVTVSARSDLDGAAEYSAILTNVGAYPVRIFPGTLFSLSFSFAKAPTAWTFMKESGVAEGVHWSKGGAYFEGTGIHKKVLEGAEQVECETNTNQDFNSGGCIPMIYLDGETVGAYVGVEWPSQRMIARATETGAEISMDYHEGFTTLLPVGEAFTVAPIYLGVYDGDVDEGSNSFKHWFFEEKTPKAMRDNENEPLVQIDPQVSPDKCADLGIQSIKWDYGWWSNQLLPDCPEGGIWKYYEGSWKLRAEGMKDYIRGNGCSTLEEYGRLMEKLGLNWTVYVLLHDSQIETEDDDRLTSVGKNGHPDWFTDVKIAGLCPVADLGNKDCVEYCKRKLFRFFSENRIKGWRSDFEPIARHSDKKNRHDAGGNDVQYWCSKGFYEIVDYLTENLPGFRYESCSSGGSMKDYATMHRATIFNNDDSADYISLRTTFYDSSYCFPPAQLQSPLDPDTFCPECPHHYAGKGDKDFGFRSFIMTPVMAGSWCGGVYKYGLDKYYKEYFTLHNEKIKPLMRHGNLYHILPRPDMIHWDGLMYAIKGKPANGVGGVCAVFKPSDEEGSVRHIMPRGLDENLTYHVNFYERKEQSFVATGKELCEKGFDVTIPESLGSDLIFFEL